MNSSLPSTGYTAVAPEPRDQADAPALTADARRIPERVTRRAAEGSLLYPRSSGRAAGRVLWRSGGAATTTDGERAERRSGERGDAHARTATTEPQPRQLGGRRQRNAVILIVENEENNRCLMEQILRYAGYQSLSARNGLEALNILDREHVDLVLTDLSMPVLDGYRATELMRRRPGAAALPIVAVTAHAMSDDRELALRSGCTDYLVKPYRPRDLVRMVERWLRANQA